MEPNGTRCHPSIPGFGDRGPTARVVSRSGVTHEVSYQSSVEPTSGNSEGFAEGRDLLACRLRGNPNGTEVETQGDTHS
jgi:hypothetical protein